MSWKFMNEYSALQRELLGLVHAATGPVLPQDLMGKVTLTAQVSRVRLALDELAEFGAIEWTNYGYAIPDRAIDPKSTNLKFSRAPRYLRNTA